MGYMRHHAIIMTSFDDVLIKEARDKANKLFSEGMVSELLMSPVNGYCSFFIAPDGSKEGWNESDEGDDAREEFKTWLLSKRYEDNSSPIDWAEVQYGDEDRVTKIVTHSDEDELGEIE